MVRKEFDGEIDIAIGWRASAKIWKNRVYTWARLVKKLSEPQITGETLRQYTEASKEDRSKLKDVGG